MEFTESDRKFIEEADNFIVNLPFNQWASTLKYSNPVLFMQILQEYEGVYEIEYDRLMKNFRKIREKQL